MKICIHQVIPSLHRYTLIMQRDNIIFSVFIEAAIESITCSHGIDGFDNKCVALPMDVAVITLYFARNALPVPGNDRRPEGTHEDGDMEKHLSFYFGLTDSSQYRWTLHAIPTHMQDLTLSIFVRK